MDAENSILTYFSATYKFNTSIGRSAQAELSNAYFYFITLTY